MATGRWAFVLVVPFAVCTFFTLNPAYAVGEEDQRDGAHAAVEEIPPAPGVSGVDPLSPDACDGDVAAQARVDTLIDKLASESLEDSFENLDIGDDYYYPGFYPEDPGYPFADRWILLSNRRITKLYEQLRVLSADEQYASLSKYFDAYLAQYSAIVSKFKLANPVAPTPDDYDALIRITELENKPPTFIGTRHALQSVAFLAGLLGNTRMWPHLRQAFENPSCGTAVNVSDYEDYVARKIALEPAFPPAFRADVIYMFACNADYEAGAGVGLDTKHLLALVPEESVSQTEVMSFHSRVTVFDVHHTLGGWPIDKTHGGYRIHVLKYSKASERLFPVLVNAAGTPSVTE